MVHVVNEIIAWAILTAQVGGFVAGLIVIVFGFVQSAGAARYSNSEGKYGFMLLLLGAVLAFLLPPFMYSINVSIKPLLITMEPALIGLFGIQPLLIIVVSVPVVLYLTALVLGYLAGWFDVWARKHRERRARS